MPLIVGLCPFGSSDFGHWDCDGLRCQRWEAIPNVSDGIPQVTGGIPRLNSAIKVFIKGIAVLTRPWPMVL